MPSKFLNFNRRWNCLEVKNYVWLLRHIFSTNSIKQVISQHHVSYLWKVFTSQSPLVSLRKCLFPLSTPPLYPWGQQICAHHNNPCHIPSQWMNDVMVNGHCVIIVLFQQMFDWFWKGQTFSFATSVHCGKFWPHFCWVSVDVVAQRSAPSQSHLYLSPFDHPQTECSSNGLRKHLFNFEIFALFYDIYCQDNAEFR